MNYDTEIIINLCGETFENLHSNNTQLISEQKCPNIFNNSLNSPFDMDMSCRKVTQRILYI